ncbi:flagellar protein FlaG [Fundidesulfovibrio terrae]|uniref:flagellar protein FlaG n=1 Tax=Fundidesulfovibrio terrae TaxID=2922866 RepID=UPI001FAF30D2|nr:flagellar protein FlaG [Fundidesulfovibrio terrae]
MNIQPTETPKDVVVAALDQERATAAVKHQDEKARPVESQDGQDQDASGHPLDKGQAEELLKKAQVYFEGKGVNLHFKTMDDSSGDVQVEVTDAQSKKVILKIPQDELVKLSENIKRMGKGVLDKAV